LKDTNGKKKAVRAELRCADPSANPYLAFSLMLAAGLKGIEKGLELPKETEDDVYEMSPNELGKKEISTLPGSLEEALDHFKRSSLAKETLGKHVFENYVKLKENEWDNYRQHVSDWEISRYLEMI